MNGSKRYITNGAIADVLTVMARTPDPRGGDSKVTAFLVTPDLPGFEVVEARMPKCGIRGTATARLAFHDMPVPATNILGPLGKGLKVALTVLDFGRTTFGASCTGAAKVCLAAATRHAASRRQFGRPLADLELIKKKIAYLAATAYAMEATTYQTAALIDRGSEDYMLETAILKVFTTEVLWQGVNETLQVFGGQGYFSNEPYERMMRDARINTIGEGANEVLKAFIALVGMRDIGESDSRARSMASRSPAHFCRRSGDFTRDHMGRMVRTPGDTGRQPHAAADGRLAGPPRGSVRPNRRVALDRQPRGHSRSPIYPGTDRRRRDRACDLGLHAVAMGSLDHSGPVDSGRAHCRRALPANGQAPVRRSLQALNQNDDRLTTAAANSALAAWSDYQPPR